MIFEDRTDAGQQLAAKLTAYQNHPDTIVLGLARGGVVVAYQVAKVLQLPLNVLVPRKIGAPGNPELAMGAIAEDGELWLNERIISYLGVLPAYLKQAAKQAKSLAEERLKRYRNVAPLADVQGKTVILIDDGIATGATLIVEIQSLRNQNVHRIVVAAPMAGYDAWQTIEKLSDEAICLDIEKDFGGISEFYRNFSEVKDEEVEAYLKASLKIS